MSEQAMWVQFGDAWVNVATVAAVVPMGPSPTTPGMRGCASWLRSGQTINIDAVTPLEALERMGVGLGRGAS